MEGADSVGIGEGRMREEAFLSPVPLAAAATREEARCRGGDGRASWREARRGAGQADALESPPRRRREGANVRLLGIIAICNDKGNEIDPWRRYLALHPPPMCGPILCIVAK